MYKNNYHFKAVMGGVGALCVVFAGQVQAVPIVAHANYGAAPPARQVNDNPNLVMPAVVVPPTLLLSVSKLISSTVAGYKQSRLNLELSGPVVLVAPVGTISYVPATINVAYPRIKQATPAAIVAAPIPDGGLTGAMLGGVFGGLMLLREKLKA